MSSVVAEQRSCFAHGALVARRELGSRRAARKSVVIRDVNRLASESCELVFSSSHEFLFVSRQSPESMSHQTRESGCPEGLDCLRHHIRCPSLFDHLNSLWLGTSECISPTAVFNNLLFKTAVRSDGLCTFCVRVISRLCHCLQFAKNQPRHWSQFQRTHARQNQVDYHPMSGVGPHVSVDVLEFQS